MLEHNYFSKSKNSKIRNFRKPDFSEILSQNESFGLTIVSSKSGCLVRGLIVSVRVGQLITDRPEKHEFSKIIFFKLCSAHDDAHGRRRRRRLEEEDRLDFSRIIEISEL